jgi:hypothetical protein
MTSNGRTKQVKREKVTGTNLEFEFTFSKQRWSGLSPWYFRIGARLWPAAALGNAATCPRPSDDSLGRPPSQFTQETKAFQSVLSSLTKSEAQGDVLKSFLQHFVVYHEQANPAIRLARHQRTELAGA